jgi:hypothetical protein
MKDMYAVLATIMLFVLVATVRANNDKPSARTDALQLLLKGSMALEYITVASSVEEDELTPYVVVHVVEGDTIRIQIGVPTDAVPLDAPRTAMVENK